jgi:hypothetical protein
MYRNVIALGAIILTANTPAIVHTQQTPNLSIPAFTVYVEPDPEAISVSEREGVTGWTDAGEKLVWYGYIKMSGTLTPEVSLTLPANENTTLKLTVAAQTSEQIVIGQGSAGTKAVFNEVTFEKPGYYSFTLEGVKKSGNTFGDIKSLTITGRAAALAQFNLKERRNAASVHLIYPVTTSEDARVAWFYNEVTVKKDPIWSYYMACGFRRGYFGVQVNSPTERRIIFSVWDSGKEAVDRGKVSADDRVQLLGKGDGVFAGGFGNEGTGGHSHLIYPWKTGQTYRFLVSAVPEGTHTVYSGYFYFPEKKAWGLIASFRAPKDGGYLRGLYSFNENFGGANGQQQRLAEFGNQWIKLADGNWTELTTAKFSHDGTGKADRLDYASGTDKDGRFILSNGGFIANGVKYGDLISRPKSGKHPADIVLPPLPPAAL